MKFIKRTALSVMLLVSVAGNPAWAQFLHSTNPGFASSLLGRPSGWTGDLFNANHAFPPLPGDVSSEPWMKLDPRKAEQRDAYYSAVLAYGLTAFSGDILTGCPKVSSNWYHAPWMTFSFGTTPDALKAGRIGSGREPICGLTQERPAPEGFLHKNQPDRMQSWAVGMFNQPGGHVLGKVWRDPSVADTSDMKYPDGTFIIKYLFTESSEAQVPYLKGSPIWLSNVYTADGASTRQTKPMRLLQIDFAVRDKRMNEQSGWVYGTYMYVNRDGSTPSDWKLNLIPVGMMWGNDEGKVSSDTYTEQALNPEIVSLKNSGLLFDLSKRHQFGWKDRVNGPIDNPASSCLSCHGTAQVHRKFNIKHFITPAATPATDANKMLWFRTIKAGETFVFTADQLKVLRQGADTSARQNWTVPLMSEFVSTDYSLQVRMGIENARAYKIQETLASLTSMKAENSKAFPKTTGLEAIQRDYMREASRIERAGRSR